MSDSASGQTKTTRNKSEMSNSQSVASEHIAAAAAAIEAAAAAFIKGRTRRAFSAGMSTPGQPY
jgi:hypothetical protein